MSGDQSRLRTTLLGLLPTQPSATGRGAGTTRLFEAGAVYLPEPGRQLPKEPYRIAALLTGEVRPPTWRDPTRARPTSSPPRACWRRLPDRLRAPWSVEATQLPYLHPGRAASILVADRVAGWLGEIHPLVAQQWDLENTVAAFELDFDSIAVNMVP